MGLYITMNITDISFHHIHIQPPKSEDENNYYFPLHYTNEYTKLLNEQQKISKDLKATREQRIKRIEDGKSSWIGLIRMLEDEEIREKEGREMEIMNMSVEQQINKLSEYHEYQDGEVDTPLLTPETVQDKKDD